MATSVQDLLNPAYLHPIQNYALLARTAVEGFLSGMHRSVLHGFGTEFVQYRNYTPGEDLKYLDWKVLARNDRLYSKVYQEETNLNCCLLVDCSASLDYQGSRAVCTKFRYALMVAACIAYLASRQGDNVGLFGYAEGLQEAVLPGHRSGQMMRVMHALTRLQAGGQANHETVLHSLARRLRQRGIVVLISDMLEEEMRLPGLLRHFRFLHCDVLAIQVLDPDERDLPQETVTRYLDSESPSEIITWPEMARSDYKAAMETYCQQLQSSLQAARIDYLPLVTSDSLGISLARYLHRRETMR